jgi:hypothetical protein
VIEIIVSYFPTLNWCFHDEMPFLAASTVSQAHAGRRFVLPTPIPARGLLSLCLLGNVLMALASLAERV